MNMFLRLSYFVLSLLLSSALAVAQGTKYEAENGILTGTVVESSATGYLRYGLRQRI